MIYSNFTCIALSYDPELADQSTPNPGHNKRANERACHSNRASRILPQTKYIEFENYFFSAGIDKLRE